MRTPTVARRCEEAAVTAAKGINMVVKSSRSTPVVSQGRSGREEPLRVTVHYRNLSGSCQGSLLSSSTSAGRWGSQHGGQADAGSSVRTAGRRVRFELPAATSCSSDGSDAGGGFPHHGSLPHHSSSSSSSNNNITHHHQSPTGTTGSTTTSSASGWSPWSARQSTSMRQPGHHQQQQQRSPWTGVGVGPASGTSRFGHLGAMHAAHGSASSASSALLTAARDGDHHALLDLLRRNPPPPPSALNHRDAQGRTPASHLAALGGSGSSGGGPGGGGAGPALLELLLQCPGVDVNQPDSEGNTPLHFAAQAGQLEALGALLRQPDVQVDARNAQGFTPLMKAALQGRTKCARALLLAGASPTLRDTGRGLRAEQWARFCGRHVCAELIERLARQRLLERGTAYGRWGSEPELQAALGRVQQAAAVNASRSIKSRVRRAFRSGTSELPVAATTSSPAFSLVSQLTGAGLCASTPALPVPSMPPVVKSLLRPLSVPRLQVTLARAS